MVETRSKGGEPTEEQPTEEQPTKEQPTKEQPTKEQPTEEQPTEEQPTEEQPTEEQPTKEQPTAEQPTGEQPTNKIEDVDDEAEDEEDEDEDDVKVTIEDFDIKTLQKQQQSTAKPAAPVLDLHQDVIECQQLDDKPWRKPGADITDYFNYGFDESTWQKYCDRQKEIKGIVDEIQEPPTFKIPVVYGPMVQTHVMAYDGSVDHVGMDNRNAPIAQSWMQQQQHQLSGGSGRLKADERRHERSRERRHVSRERRHSKSRDREREREKDKDKNKERKGSRDRRSKESRTRQRSRSREDERRSKRQKTSRHH